MANSSVSGPRSRAKAASAKKPAAKAPAKRARSEVASEAPATDGRKRIVEAARRRFAVAGFAGTSTVEIARDAGVTHPLVHHHFGSKERLWHAVVDDIFADLPELTRGTSYEDGDVVGWLEEMVGRLVVYAATHRDMAGLICREGTSTGPHAEYVMERHLRPVFQLAIDALRRGQEQGVVVRDQRPEVMLFVALGAGVHVFNVAAHARAFGIDVDDAGTRAEVVSVFRRLVFGGLVSPRDSSSAPTSQRTEP